MDAAAERAKIRMYGGGCSKGQKLLDEGRSFEGIDATVGEEWCGEVGRARGVDDST